MVCGSQTTPGKEVGGMEEVHFPLLLLMYIIMYMYIISLLVPRSS